jgi:hypothetical protein
MKDQQDQLPEYLAPIKRKRREVIKQAIEETGGYSNSPALNESVDHTDILKIPANDQLNTALEDNLHSIFSDIAGNVADSMAETIEFENIIVPPTRDQKSMLFANRYGVIENPEAPFIVPSNVDMIASLDDQIQQHKAAGNHVAVTEYEELKERLLDQERQDIEASEQPRSGYADSRNIIRWQQQEDGKEVMKIKTEEDGKVEEHVVVKELNMHELGKKFWITANKVTGLGTVIAEGVECTSNVYTEICKGFPITNVEEADELDVTTFNELKPHMLQLQAFPAMNFGKTKSKRPRGEAKAAYFNWLKTRIPSLQTTSNDTTSTS